MAREIENIDLYIYNFFNILFLITFFLIDGQGLKFEPQTRSFYLSKNNPSFGLLEALRDWREVYPLSSSRKF